MANVLTKLQVLELKLEAMQQLHMWYNKSGSHHEADELLVEALELLAKGTKYGGLVKQLIASFNELDKWYA